MQPYEARPNPSSFNTKKRKKTILKLPPISTRNLTALISVVNNAFANAVLPRIAPNQEEWSEWLAMFGVPNEKGLTCAYCAGSAELLDHLNPTMIDKKASGFFAELANLVPSCRPCNESRGNKRWEPWLRIKHADHGVEIIEGRIAVMRRFEQWRKPECLDPRKSGDADRWLEYDSIRAEIHDLLRKAQTVAEELRTAVTADYETRRNLS